jgi:ABC-type transporter Mla subunit MlaD
MARKANSTLEQALALLIQNQATFVSNLNETNQRFSRIESQLEQIKAILLRQEQTLNTLHEASRAIRDKMGFTPRP